MRSFLGLINNYHRFLPNPSTAVHPLIQLLEKNHQWKWKEQCEAAFYKVKEMITSEQVLTHYRSPSLGASISPDFLSRPFTEVHLKIPRKVSYFRESRMSPWKNIVGRSLNQKPVVRPFFLFYDVTADGIWVSWNTRLSMKRWDDRSEMRITERLSLRMVLIFNVIHSPCKHPLWKESTIKRTVDDLELYDGQRRKSASITGFLSSSWSFSLSYNSFLKIQICRSLFVRKKC